MKKTLVTFCSILTCLLLVSSKSVFALAPQFILGSANNVTTSTVVIPIRTTNFTQILGWQGSINWDNSKLTYGSISTPVSQLSGMQFSASVSSSTGRLSFVWVDNNLVPQNIPDSTVLFNITLNVVNGSVGFSNVLFSNNPTQLTVSDANGAAITNVVYTNGVVSFPGTPIPPEFMIGSANNVTTSTLVIPVRTRNFFQLLAWQGSINWDNTKITFSAVTGIVPQLNGIQFNPSVSATTGRLSFIWSDNNVISQTIADSTILFNITFNVISGSTGLTSIIFSNTPTPGLVSDANSTAVNNVTYTSGNIAFPGSSLPPVFIIGSLYNVNASTIIVPVTTKNFTQLLGWQGSINWDNTKLTLLSTSVPVSQLNGMSFNASVNNTVGRLSFIWSDNNVSPQTIPDNTVLFTLTFNVVSGATGITYLTFSNTPTPLVVSNQGGTAVTNVTYSKGTVTFSLPPCNGGSTTVTSNITGLGYQWQLNSGGGWNNISDNSTYSGTNTSTLVINNVPATMTGFQYRCLVNGLFSNVFILRFYTFWKGTINDAWENPGNWSCGSVPDANMDIFINSSLPLLEIKSNVSCRSLHLSPGTTVNVFPGFTLTITGL